MEDKRYEALDEASVVAEPIGVYADSQLYRKYNYGYSDDKPNETTIAAIEEAMHSDNLETLRMEDFYDFVNSL